MDETKKVIKIDSYDFFGYLVPGFILFVSLAAAHLQAAINKDPRLYRIINIESLQNAYVAIIIATILVLIVSYILGHAIATVASMFFERMIAKHIFGYPYERLLFDNMPNKQSNYYKSFVVYVYLTILVTILLQQYAHDIVKYCDSKWLSALAGLTIWTILLYICVKFCCLYMIFDAIEHTVNKIFGSGKQFPTKIRSLIHNKFEMEYKINIDDADTEVFWATYWKVITKHDYAKEKIDKWLVLYSFMRNVGASLLVSSIILCTINIFGSGNFLLFIHSLLLYVLSILVVARYYYLYYSYYTKSVFRAYIFLKEDEPTP